MRKTTKNLSNFNLPHKCIKPDLAKIDTLYTFSYNPKYQPHQDMFGRMDINNLEQWEKDICKKLKSLKYCKFNLTLDISSGGRLHYHGYIKILNLVSFYFHDIHILQYEGTYEIDIITDPACWYNYVKKLNMQDFCLIHNISQVIKTLDVKAPLGATV